MNSTEDPITQIERLDRDLFTWIESQSSPMDRTAFLALQRATAACFGRYSYLEIGSYLGGTIVPHLLDPRCEAVFSIDPRPDVVPDDREGGTTFSYAGITAQTMLDGLRKIAPASVGKIRCFDSDAAQVDVAALHPRPRLALIDGEHTVQAVLADFDFCLRAITPDGAILFHDANIIYPALEKAVARLRAERRPFVELVFDGTVFALCFSPELVQQDPHLRSVRDHGRRLRQVALKERIRRFTPAPVLRLWKRLRGPDAAA